MNPNHKKSKKQTVVLLCVASLAVVMTVGTIFYVTNKSKKEKQVAESPTAAKETESAARIPSVEQVTPLQSKQENMDELLETENQLENKLRMTREKIEELYEKEKTEHERIERERLTKKAELDEKIHKIEEELQQLEVTRNEEVEARNSQAYKLQERLNNAKEEAQNMEKILEDLKVKISNESEDFSLKKAALAKQLEVLLSEKRMLEKKKTEKILSEDAKKIKDLEQERDKTIGDLKENKEKSSKLLKTLQLEERIKQLEKIVEEKEKAFEKLIQETKELKIQSKRESGMRTQQGEEMTQRKPESIAAGNLGQKVELSESQTGKGVVKQSEHSDIKPPAGDPERREQVFKPLRLEVPEEQPQTEEVFSSPLDQ